jgi:hypothetical protein
VKYEGVLHEFSAEEEKELGSPVIVSHQEMSKEQGARSEKLENAGKKSLLCQI